MRKIVLFLILLTRFPQNNNTLRACTPNSRVLMKDKVCQCNNEGQWADNNCQSVDRKACRPGQLVSQGCNRCVCQENGQLSCTEEPCSSQQLPIIHTSLHATLPLCTPFRKYYINCNICTCPASGKSIDAKCVVDVSCTLFKEPTPTELYSKVNTCLPKVMYLFPCMHCLCPDEGLLSMDKCINSCANITRQCIPGTLYRHGCNVCHCTATGVPDHKLCTNANCTEKPSFQELQHLRNRSYHCTANYFTKPICMFCNCKVNGTVDEKSCLELECLKSADVVYDIARETCKPGEMVPFCTECLCPRNGITSGDYCTKSCSYQSKVQVLEQILASGHRKAFSGLENNVTKDKQCDRNSIYYVGGKYCVCPETGKSENAFCSAGAASLAEHTHTANHQNAFINFSKTCEPHTLVNFDCNSCVCMKNGTYDPKWCTFDDCKAKNSIKEYYASQNRGDDHIMTELTICTPGSIFQVDCNFCICSDTGVRNNSSCTKIDCRSFPNATSIVAEHISCEPGSYYPVDCNVCSCPRDGIKNVAKCTRTICDKGFLRSTDVCAPGQLFSDGCNICICPINGDRLAKTCTKTECSDATSWKTIYQLSEVLLGSQLASVDATRSVDLCFPREEYVSGCKLCICPDMGLRYYAVCTPSFCEGEDRTIPELTNNRHVSLRRKPDAVADEECDTDEENIVTKEKAISGRQCSPGSMYIIKCKQCICPYSGNLEYFCRPLPPDFFCEQAYPNIDFVKRRQSNVTTSWNETGVHPPRKIRHKHTRYECDAVDGKYMDRCFICQCEKGSVITEHCFRNNATQCVGARPSFFFD